MNDRPNSTTTSPLLFADDTCLVLSSPSIPSLTQTCYNELRNLKSWCDAIYLQVNPCKSVSLIIPFKQNKPIHEMQLFYNESVVANKDVCKYFGVIIDSKLNFKAFIDHVESKIAKSVGILSRLRYLFPSSTLLLLYFSLVQPDLLYEFLLWESTFSSYLTNLQRLQNKALRIISNSSYRASTTPVYHKLRILKISDM